MTPIPDAVYSTWDLLKDATQRVECALPSQLTDAVARLVAARQTFEKVLMTVERPIQAWVHTYDGIAIDELDPTTLLECAAGAQRFIDFQIEWAKNRECMKVKSTWDYRTVAEVEKSMASLRENLIRLIRLKCSGINLPQAVVDFLLVEHPSQPSRYHLSDGGVRIQTTEGEITLGRGWLVISEIEYERMRWK